MTKKTILTPSQKARKERNERIVKAYLAYRKKGAVKTTAILAVCNDEGISFSTVNTVVREAERQKNEE